MFVNKNENSFSVNEGQKVYLPHVISSSLLQLRAEIALNFDSPQFIWQMQMVFKEFFQGHTTQMNEPIHTYLVNQAHQSATFRIRSAEWKFLNTLWIRNRMDAKSGYIFIRWRNKIEPSSLPWRLYSRLQPRRNTAAKRNAHEHKI